MLRTLCICVALLCVGLGSGGCQAPVSNTHGEPSTPNHSPQKPVEPAKGLLAQKWQLSLPRQIDGLFVKGASAYICTREGSLHKQPPTARSTYELMAVDLVTGRKKWSAKDTLCMFQIIGTRLYFLRRKVAHLELHTLELDSGKALGSFNILHQSCHPTRFVGAGEQIINAPLAQGKPCLQFSAVSGGLLFVTEQQAKFIEPSSGKLKWYYSTGALPLIKHGTNRVIPKLPPSKNESISHQRKRIVSVNLHGDRVYVMEAIEDLSTDSNGFPSLPANRAWKYQLRAIAWKTNEERWSAGPFPNPVIQSRVDVFEDQILVQVLTSRTRLRFLLEDRQHLLQAYSKSSWEGKVQVTLLNRTTGKLERTWKGMISFDKQIQMPLPLMKPVLRYQELFLLRAKGTIYALSSKEAAIRWKYQSKESELGQLQVLGDGQFSARGMLGKVTLFDIGSKGGSGVNSRYGHLIKVPAQSTQNIAGQSPTRWLHAKGLCRHLSGLNTPMDEIDSSSRFFLPPARKYYGMGMFFLQYCVNYAVTLHSLAGEKLYTTYLLEAPTAMFLKQNLLHTLSDNGDWHAFDISPVATLPTPSLPEPPENDPAKDMKSMLKLSVTHKTSDARAEWSLLQRLSPPKIPWSDMSALERERYMARNVMPIMSLLFGAFSNTSFSSTSMGCLTCHGDPVSSETALDNFDFSTPTKLAPLDPKNMPTTNSPNLKLARKVRFMQDIVTPVMGLLLGRDDVGCFTCHAEKQ